MSISIRGLASGLDVDDIIDQLVEIERRPIYQMEAEKGIYQKRIESWQDVNTRLYNLRTAGNSLLEIPEFAPLHAASSDTSVATAMVTGDIDEGLFNLEVFELAQYHRVASSQVEDANEPLEQTGQILINGVEISIEEDHSLSEIRDMINSATGPQLSYLEIIEEEGVVGLEAAALQENVSLVLQEGEENIVQVTGDGEDGHIITVNYTADSTAEDIHSLLQAHEGQGEEEPAATDLASFRLGDGTLEALDFSQDLIDPGEETDTGVNASIIDNRLILQSATSGTEGIIEVEDPHGIMEYLGLIDEEENYLHVLREAQDAHFRLDGQDIHRSSNTVDDLIDGITFELRGPGSTWIETDRNYEDIMEHVVGFVEQYNSTYQFLKEKMGEGELLQGDSALMRIQSGIRQMLMDTVGLGLNEGVDQAGVLGFSIDRETGLLDLDQGKFMATLREKPEQVQALFQGQENFLAVLEENDRVGLEAKSLGQEVRLTMKQSSEAGVQVSSRDDGSYRVDVHYTAGATAGDIYNLLVQHEAGEDEPAAAREIMGFNLVHGDVTARDGSERLTGAGFDGISRRLDDYLDLALRSGQGTIAQRQLFYNNVITDLENRMERMEERVQMTRDRLVRQFTALETVLQEMMSESQWLSQQLRSLEGLSQENR